MSKKVKNLITKELTDRLGKIDGVGVINHRGLGGIKTNLMRRRLRANGMKMTVVKNTLAKKAVNGKKLEGFDKLLDGPSAVIYGEAASISAVDDNFLAEEGQRSPRASRHLL